MVLKIGHRGACGYEPENTLSSFKKAIELDVDMIEFDVHACNTGELVVIHDDKVDRTTDGTGYVSERSFQELRKLDAGNKEKIPTLKEVLDLIDGKVKVNIELKGENTARLVFEVIEKYVKEKGWSYEDFLISSFIHHELKEIYRLNPEIRLGVLIAEMPVGFPKFAEKIKAYSLNISIKSIYEGFVQAAHKRGMKVFVWTVDDIGEIERMKQLGVDGIFSNFPDRI